MQAGAKKLPFFSAATLQQLPDAGHFLPLEAPAAFAAAIAEALAR